MTQKAACVARPGPVLLGGGTGHAGGTRVTGFPGSLSPVASARVASSPPRGSQTRQVPLTVEGQSNAVLSVTLLVSPLYYQAHPHYPFLPSMLMPEKQGRISPPLSVSSSKRIMSISARCASSAQHTVLQRPKTASSRGD